MEHSETDGDARIRALENKIQGIEPLVRGLIEETLDLKSVFLSKIKEDDEFRRQERERETIARSHSISVAFSPHCSAGSDNGPDHAGRRHDENGAPTGDRNQTDSTAGYGPARKSKPVTGKQESLISVPGPVRSDRNGPCESDMKYPGYR